MKLLKGNVLYEFTVEQGTDDNADSICDYNSDSNSYQILRIAIRYRKFEAPIRRPTATTHQSLDLPLLSAQPLMSQILAQFEVPASIGNQMAEHFKFFADRLARRLSGEISVSVRLDEKVMPPGREISVRARMESARAADVAAPRRRREEEDEEAVPARRSAIEAMEKVRVGEGGRECAICLEDMREGEEAARMPCGHLYHCRCIAEWLQRTHFCPFCRFKMPC